MPQKTYLYGKNSGNLKSINSVWSCYFLFVPCNQMQNQEDMANFFLVLTPIRKKGHISRINVLYDFVNAPASCQSSCQYYSSSINQQEYGPISSPGVEQFEMHEFLVVKQSFPLRLVLSSALHELCTQ